MEDIKKELEKIEEFYAPKKWEAFSLLSEDLPSADKEVNLKLLASSEAIEELLGSIRTNLKSLDKSASQEALETLVPKLSEEVRTFRVLFLTASAGKSSEESMALLNLEKTNLLYNEHLQGIVALLKDRASNRN